MRASRRINDVVSVRLPIKKPLLRLIVDKLEGVLRNQYYLQVLYRAFFMLAYYGLFHVGELTTSDHPVKVTDVCVGHNKKKVQVMLRTSKTHGLGNMPQKVKIESYEHKVQLVILRNGEGLETEVDRKYCLYKFIQDFVVL